MTNRDSITRGLYTDVIDIRRKVFASVAEVILNYDHKNPYEIIHEISKIPFQIISRKDPTYRCCVYKERSIVAERIRLTLGLPLWEGIESGHLYKGIETVLKPHKTIELPIVNVMSEACEKCPTKAYVVTNNCRKCLAHPCSVVCPVNAVYFSKDSAVIDQEKCIKCGKCQQACPYNAIVNYDRPCAAACGVDAIKSDETGRAKIDYNKCVRCGQCIVACPFGAIADKSEFIQMLIALKEKKTLYAIVAPSFLGQFGPHATPGNIFSAIKKIGFGKVMEVAYGADIATLQESKEWYHKIYEEKQGFLGTSCCPAWVDLAKKNFPETASKISDSYTPMVATAKAIKENDPNAIVTFIGPCVAKKVEALRPEVSPFVDFVITFEELASVFVAMDIDLADITENEVLEDASGSGRNYAVSGGVVDALKINVLKEHPDADIRIEKADSLHDCKKMLLLAKAGKLNANLIEGMACPGGCVGGPGILSPIRRTSVEVSQFAKASSYYASYENPKINQQEEK